MIQIAIATQRHAAEFEDLAVAAFGDAESYRFLALGALTMLHAAAAREASLREQLRHARDDQAAVRDELRRYTAARAAA